MSRPQSLPGRSALAPCSALARKLAAARLLALAQMLALAPMLALAITAGLTAVQPGAAHAQSPAPAGATGPAPSTPSSPRPPPPALAALPEIPVGPVLNGKPADVIWSALRGKVVLLDFFSYSCKPCLKAMPDLVELQAAHADRLRIVGYHIGRGSSADVQPIVTKFALNYPVVFPPDWENPKVMIPGADFMATFGMEMLPCAVLVDTAGKLRHWNLRPADVAPRVAELLAEGKAKESGRD